MLSLFLSVQHQWKVDHKGRRLGLDYVALETAARLSGIEIDPEAFAIIQALENEILKPCEQSSH